LSTHISLGPSSNESERVISSAATRRKLVKQRNRDQEKKEEEEKKGNPLLTESLHPEESEKRRETAHDLHRSLRRWENFPLAKRKEDLFI